MTRIERILIIEAIAFAAIWGGAVVAVLTWPIGG